MVRLFTAVPLPEALRQRLSLLALGLPDVRWVPEENLHLTLTFIGNVSSAQLADVIEALAPIDGESFPLHLSGCGHFESRGRVRTLWLRAKEVPELMTLQERVQRTLIERRFIERGRRYIPHITIGRLRGTLPRAIADWLTANEGFDSGPYLIDHFALYSSQLTEGGPIYRIEAEFPLK